MDRPDSELMLSTARGDLEAFRLLVERHQSGIINFFHRLTWDRYIAEDCAQEVFCRVYRARQNYQATARFTTYLYRIARNYWIDRCRKLGRRPREFSLDAPSGTAKSPGETSFSDGVAGGEISPQEALSRKELQETVRSAIDALPEGQRLVILLAETQGLKYQEIAEILQIPLGTVKSRMHAAVGRLRGSLDHVLRE